MTAVALELRAPDLGELTLDEVMTGFSEASNDEHREWFEEIERRMRRVVPIWILEMGASADDVDDFTQQTWLEIVQYRDSYRSGRGAVAWIKSIALHVVHDDVRAKGRKCRKPDGDILRLDDQEGDQADHQLRTPLSQAMLTERQQIVREKLAGLPDAIRQSMELFYFESKSVEEIAGQLGIPEGTIKWQLSRGRKLMREALAFRQI